MQINPETTMLMSMTAFSAAEVKIHDLIIYCELRSVNHRYCDLTVKLPESLRFADPMIRDAVSSRLKRGKIECTVTLKQSDTLQFAGVDMTAVKALLTATLEIEQAMKNPRSFSALDVLNFPGIQQQTDVPRETLEKGLQGLIKAALTDMLEAREREGAQLGRLIDRRCREMLRLIKQAGQRIPDVQSQLREKLTARIAELCAAPDFDRLEQELVLLAQKMDVEEELDRQKTHVEEVLRVLSQSGPAGRRLDFLMQEMNREANTLGSKSSDKELTRISIDMKVMIEQMREQIQNIE